MPDHQLYTDLQKTNHTFLKVWMKIGIHAHWLFWGHGNVIEHLKYPGHRQMSTLRWLSYYGNQINTKPKLNPNKSRAREDPNPTAAAAKRERAPEGIFRRKGSALCRHFELPRGEFLTSGRSGSAGPPGWARRSAGSARSPRPRYFCSLPPWGSAGRSNAAGCAWNWRHLAPWGCLSSLNNAGKGNKISFDCTDTKPEVLFIIIRVFFFPEHVKVKYWSEVAILILPGQNFWIKLDNFLDNTGCLPQQDLPNGEDYKIWLSEWSQRVWDFHTDGIPLFMCEVRVGMEAGLPQCLHSGRYQETSALLPNVVQIERRF